MINIRKAAAALCLSGFVIGGTATTALASTASTSQATTIAQATSTAQAATTSQATSIAQADGYWCGYQVFRTSHGLYVRSGPGTYYRILGGLFNGQRTTGSCATVRGWVNLSNKYNHYGSPVSWRGWSYGYYLHKPSAPVYWCGYQVILAPRGLFVRSGPGTYYRILGGLFNGQRTTGSCATVRGWVNLSNMYNHYGSPVSWRGWSYGYYLRK
jgi:uncharacterized protein YgiM (DUF1202 family)